MHPRCPSLPQHDRERVAVRQQLLEERERQHAEAEAAAAEEEAARERRLEALRELVRVSDACHGCH